MKRSGYISLAVISLLTFTANAREDENNWKADDPDIIRRIHEDHSASKKYGVWTIMQGKRTRNNFSALVAKSNSEGLNDGAYLVVSCIRSRPGVSVIYPEAVNQISTFSPKSVEVITNESKAVTYYGSALINLDGAGVFDAEGYALIASLRESRSVRIRIPEQDISWDFDLDGLGISLELMRDRCAFSYQMRINYDQMRSIQFKMDALGYVVPNDGSVNSKMTSGIRRLQRLNGLEVTGRLDSPTMKLLSLPSSDIEPNHISSNDDDDADDDDDDDDDE